MGIFSSIKEAVFGSDRHERVQTPQPAPEARPAQAPTAATGPAAAPSHSASVQVIDVENNLDHMPGADRLNWRTSIVDLMKLIGVESSFENRQALASELGRSNYEGTAEDNVWLHRRTMQELSRNGGKVPAEFLD